ncbi:MAG TPA: MmcQ/YjbR family DNA-binding protein [Vicinamibacterales bacterium]|nr:MmcQ/YjbR family DNA-binding protein [Vicinamibacterales bacterium]
MTFAGVRAIGLKLPGAEEGTSWGTPALKVGGKMFACIASHKSAEPNTLVVYIDLAQRDALIAEDPDTYYLKEHYVNYPVVLVRLSRVHPDAMRDLLAGAWRIVSARQRPRRRTTARSRSTPRRR